MKTKQLKPGKDYRFQFICKEKGIIKTNDINVVYDLILHDKDGIPALQEFYLNGKIFCKTHYKDDKLHNLNGAARVYYNLKGEITAGLLDSLKLKDEYYWIEGKYYTKQEWEQKIKELKGV